MEISTIFQGLFCSESMTKLQVDFPRDRRSPLPQDGSVSRVGSSASSSKGLELRLDRQEPKPQAVFF